jgi:hypothetical protein
MIGFLMRFVLALILVFATWNPAGRSFVHWAMSTLPNVTAPLAFAGIVLLIGWILFLHATLESLGGLGIVLAAAFFGTLTWLLFDQGWLSTQNDVTSYVGLTLIASILAIGMSWSHVWRRLSGQVDVHETDSN